MQRIFGHCTSFIETSTYQFDDYTQYAMTFFDGAKRLKRRQTVFEKDCEKVRELGKKLCKGTRFPICNQ
jgi:hypothetical protein